MSRPTVQADDPRLDSYRNLTDAALRRSYEASHGLFVLEGARVVRHAVEAGWGLVSLLAMPGAIESVSDVASRVEKSGGDVLVAERTVLYSVAGFAVHRGVLGLSRRPAGVDPEPLLRSARLAVVVEGVNDHENLGAIFRNSAAFGVDAVLLDPRTCDPLYRRSVRVSIGHVLTVPYARLDPWPGGLASAASAGLSLLALHPGAASTIDQAAEALTGRRVAVMVGAEGSGLSDSALGLSAVAARIPMARGVDSLNVATSLAVALHFLAVRRGATDPED